MEMLVVPAEKLVCSWFKGILFLRFFGILALLNTSNDSSVWSDFLWAVCLPIKAMRQMQSRFLPHLRTSSAMTTTKR